MTLGQIRTKIECQIIMWSRGAAAAAAAAYGQQDNANFQRLNWLIRDNDFGRYGTQFAYLFAREWTFRVIFIFQQSQGKIYWAPRGAALSSNDISMEWRWRGSPRRNMGRSIFSPIVGCRDFLLLLVKGGDDGPRKSSSICRYTRKAGRQAGLDCSYSSDEIMTELGSHTRN